MLYTEPDPTLPPLTSGLVGYLGWDVVRHWEHLPFPPADDVNLPEFALNMVSDMAIHDNKDGTVLLVANAINFNGTSENVDGAYEDAVARLHSMLRRLQRGATATTSTLSGVADVDRKVREDVTLTWSEQGFKDAIDRSKKNIIDGDVFQIVLSRRFEAETNAKALDVYRVLRQSNPSPYMYLFNFEDSNGTPSTSSAPPRRRSSPSRTASPAPTPSPVPARAAQPAKKTSHSPRNCSPTRRNAPNTSCSSTWHATTSRASPSPEPYPSTSS